MTYLILELERDRVILNYNCIELVGVGVRFSLKMGAGGWKWLEVCGEGYYA